ncbi:hypothetical protein Ancab_033111 [Ancistrocladus abbreviatus]
MKASISSYLCLALILCSSSCAWILQSSARALYFSEDEWQARSEITEHCPRKEFLAAVEVDKKSDGRDQLRAAYCWSYSDYEFDPVDYDYDPFDAEF